MIATQLRPLVSQRDHAYANEFAPNQFPTDALTVLATNSAPVIAGDLVLLGGGLVVVGVVVVVVVGVGVVVVVVVVLGLTSHHL